VNPRYEEPYDLVIWLHIEYRLYSRFKRSYLKDPLYTIFTLVSSGIARTRLKNENVSGNGPNGGSKMVSLNIVYIYFLNRRVRLPLPNIRRNLVK